MEKQRRLVFPPFSFDASNIELSREGKRIPLRPKTLAVLHYLVEHPNRVISKQELLDSVWESAMVVDGSLKVCIQEIRKALGDSATHPRYVETVSQKGYRFVAPVTPRLSADGGPLENTERTPICIVGRQFEIQLLRNCLEKAATEARQTIFVTGEPGIGKTTLLELFTQSQSFFSNRKVISAHGHCVEQFGTGEPFMPFLDALEALCHSPTNNHEIAGLARRYAPSWIANLPSLREPTDRNASRTGPTQKSMLREIAVLLETISKEKVLVLVLEDLQWADPSTLTLISFLSNRKASARLMLIGTSRDIYAPNAKYSFRTLHDELQLHGQCILLPLEPLGRTAIREYLSIRFAVERVSEKLVSELQKTSEGNPLFMVKVTDYLLANGRILQTTGSLDLKTSAGSDYVPPTIRLLLERQLETLPTQDLRLLEAASVAGNSFSAAALSAGLGTTVENVEHLCAKLARRGQFLKTRGMARWPDGTPSSRYSFSHALYQNVLYEKLTGSRRSQLHRKVGERIETAYKPVTDEVAGELALHFERAGDAEKAVRYYVAAARRNVRRSAYNEALAQVNSALNLVPLSANTPDLMNHELELQLLKAASQMNLTGYATKETEDAYANTLRISKQVKDPSIYCNSLAGIFPSFFHRGRYIQALAVAKEQLAVARRIKDSLLALNGFFHTGVTFFYLGQFERALKQFDACVRLYHQQGETAKTYNYVWDACLLSLIHMSWTYWFLGCPDEALAKNRHALELADALKQPISTCTYQTLAPALLVYYGDLEAALELTSRARALADEHGFNHWLAGAKIVGGWALTEKRDYETAISEMTEGLRIWESMGAQLEMSRYLSWLAKAYWGLGQRAKARKLIDQALAKAVQTGEGFYRAEIHTLKGEMAQSSRTSTPKLEEMREAEGAFLTAIELSRNQRARSLELRATTRLARLWQKTGKSKPARKMLARIMGRFREGLETADFKQAKALLEELS